MKRSTTRPRTVSWLAGAAVAALWLIGVAGIPSKAGAQTVPPVPEAPKMSKEEFEQGKTIYFQRCAGCHGTLRAGATGPELSPAKTIKLGEERLKDILQYGMPGGMPAWGEDGILNEQEIEIISRYIRQEPPAPPELPLEEIKKSWKVYVPLDQRPKKVAHKRNWENFFGVVLRDKGEVAIIDGDTKEKIAVIKTGYAVHILRSSSSGRYFYVVGRDGRISLIDLWSAEPSLVAEVKPCIDARSVDASKYHGPKGDFSDKLAIVGCYWPPHFTILDGLTLEPKKLIRTSGYTYDTNEYLPEVRVASIIASHFDPLWVVSLKESGYVWLVDYSDIKNLRVAMIEAERFLHDGGWDATKRYFLVAANMRNRMSVIDVKEKKFIANIDTGKKPHPGRGANWVDPEFGPVYGTTHIGEGQLTLIGTDPAKHKKHAWQVVRQLELKGRAGGLFIKTHDKSPWVWTDAPLNSEAEKTQTLCVYSKKKAQIEKCFQAADRGRLVHFEYNKAGDEVWVSVWDKTGEILVYDDKTLTLKTKITGDWLVTPTGKFNVFNTRNDVY
ncbi:MAG: cytochrome D1 domain-containing protein [Bdellovibrionota bacterium]